MKKKGILVLVLTIIAVTLIAQRPIRRVQNESNVHLERTDMRVTSPNNFYYIIEEMSIPNITVIDANITVASSNNKIRINYPSVAEYNYIIYDANDQAIIKYSSKSQTHSFDFRFDEGEYRLQIIDPKGAEKNFKIIKKRK